MNILYQGNILIDDVVITQTAEHEEEMMKSDFVRLSWDSATGDVLPVDAYIEPFDDGVQYRLFEPYTPEQKSEDTYHYEPQFQHPKMYLSKVPFVRDSYDTERNPITLMEWSYTGFIGTLLEYFCNAINAAFGFTDEDVIEYLMVGEFENIVSTTFTAQDILSALSNVANQLECEWHIDWHEKTLYFGHIQIDRQEPEEPVLEVDSNIGVPSVRNSKSGYWNAYQPQGSTRNITVRAASGENVQANVRLALNKTQYPDGIIYTDGEGHTLTKAQFDALGLTPYIKSVIYESVYPKLDLFVYDVRYRERYLLDDDGNKVIDHYEGSTPVYKRYAVWFMRLAYPTYNQQGEVTGWTDYTIDPETQVIDGKVLMGAFQANTREGAETSPLAGQGDGDGEHYGFELAYHETGEVIPPGSDGEGDTGVTIKAGDYEIILQQKDDFIIPSTPDVGMIPKGKTTPSLLGNVVNLYNIVMSDDYLVSAQNELENETLKTIAHDTEDNNSYTFKALETAFEQSNPNLYIGRKVTYRNGDYELRTRVMKLVTKLDYSFEQEITIGNEVLKGNQTTMREKVDTLITAFAQGGGGLSQNQVLRLIENWVTPRFLSKIKEDTAAGRITFQQGMEALMLSVFNGIRNNGRVTSDEADIPRFVSDTTIDGILHVLAKIVANQIESDNFNGDGPFDTGFELTKSDGNGYSLLVVDKLYVRLKAIFNELEIRKISYSGGNFIFSHAGSHIVYVKELQLGVESEVEGTVLKLSGAVDVADNVLNVGSGSVSGSTLTLSSDKRVYAYRCYIMKDDGTTATENWWRVDDQARCQTFNVVEPGHYENVENTSYWRRVIAVGHEKVRLNDSEQEQEYDYVDLSLNDCMQGSDIPKAGDQIVQMGNRTDAERQGFISLEVAGEYAPAFKVYKGVNYYTLDGKRKICISPKLTDIRAQKFTIETEYDTRLMPMERGDWSRVAEHKCYYYNLVQHNGATWLCVCPEGEYTTEEPSETATYWRPYAQKGKDGKDGKSFNILGSYDTEAELIAAHPTGSVGDAYMVAGDLYVWDEVNTRWHNSGRIQGDAGRGIASAEIVYGVSENPATLPTEWEASPAELTIGPGDYLFVRTTLRYDDGTDAAPYYSISRFGVDGSFKQTAFTRTNKNISSQQLSGKPLPNDFVFDGETIHFSDGIPSGEKRVWATSNIFYGDGTQSGWTALTPMTDTSTFDVEFSPNETKPANPSDDESQREAQGWYDPTRNPSHDFSTTIWRAERQKKNGEWGAWAIEKVKGEKGDSVAYDEEHSSIGYAYSSMGTPESGRDYPSDITSWSSTPPAVQKGKYLWTKDVTAYDNAGTIVYTTTYGVQYQPNDGESVEIDSSRTFIKYCRQTKSQYTGQHPADSEFSLTYPTNLGQGDYLWILNQVAYVGVANPLKSYSVSMLGTDGGKGDPGADGYTTHFAYAASADGSQNFSTTNFNGATYIGTYRDQKADDSTDYRHYVWTAWKGDNGRGITSVNKYFKADTATTPATPSGAPSGTGWSDDGNSLIIPANADKHLYESTCTAYSDGTYSWTTPIDDGLISDMASTAEEFALSDSNTAAPTSGWASSVSPVAGKWIWSRTVLTFKSGNPTYINTQCVGYCGTNGRDGADSVTTALSTQTVEIPTDTDGVCLEDTQVELSARLFVRSKEVKVTDIVVDEQSSQRVTSVVKSTLDMMPWATSADASVQGNVITFSRNASVQGNVLTIGGDAFNVTPSKVVVTIAKGTVVDEHTVNLRVTGVDEDKTTHYGFAAFNVQRHYIPVDGQDAINIIVTPAALIVNQSLQNPDNLSQLSEEIIFSATMGERQVAVNKVEVTSTEHCTVEGSNGNKATVRAIGTYTEEGSHYFYDKANFICKVYTAYGVIENIKADIYANLLGTWKETVEADTKTEVARSLTYGYDPESGEVIPIENFGSFIKSSEENISELQGTVYDEDHNVKLVTKTTFEQTINRISLSVESKENINLVTDPDIYQPSTAGITRDVSLIEERTYVLSAQLKKMASTVPAILIILKNKQTESVVTSISCTFGSEQTKIFTSNPFTITDTATYTISIGSPNSNVILQWLQLEQGEAFTQHNSISSAFKRTGIDIENGTINLQADKVTFSDSNGGNTDKIWIDPANGTLHAVGGDFSGKITATDGTIGGFVIGSDNIHSTAVDSSSSPLIQLNDDGSARLGGLVVTNDGNATLTGTINATSGNITGDINVGPANGQHMLITPNDKEVTVQSISWTVTKGVQFYNGSAYQGGLQFIGYDLTLFAGNKGNVRIDAGGFNIINSGTTYNWIRTNINNLAAWTEWCYSNENSLRLGVARGKIYGYADKSDFKTYSEAYTNELYLENGFLKIK